MIEDISEEKGVLIEEIVLIIVWFYYLGHLDKLNETLKEYYSSSDGAVVRAFKIITSEQTSSIMGYLLGGLVLLALLIGVVVLFKKVNISVALITGILNLILMLFVFKSLLAPILVSIIILLVVVAIVMFCFNN